jgi:hypothetical protein
VLRLLAAAVRVGVGEHVAPAVSCDRAALAARVARLRATTAAPIANRGARAGWRNDDSAQRLDAGFMSAGGDASGVSGRSRNLAARASISAASITPFSASTRAMPSSQCSK